MLTVWVVSDATGETAERIARSALVQFEGADVLVQRRSQVTTAGQVRSLVEEAARGPALIVHTLVSDELRQRMLAESRLHEVDSLDLLGPLLDRLAIHLGATPLEKPGLFHQLAEKRAREIEAVAFAFRHDDGQNVDDLHRAEVILVGASRTMKTPVMLYLAYRGWFAANVPLIPAIPAPQALLDQPTNRVFCLVMRPELLRERRLVRAAVEAIPAEPYASLGQIAQEMQYVDYLCHRHRWARIDVAGKAVEEVAREIITLTGRER